MQKRYWQLGVLIILLTLPQGPTHGARILCLSHQFGSHMLILHTIAEGLIERGHEVYTLYSDQMKVPKDLQEKGFKILTYHTRENSDFLASGHLSSSIVEEVLEGKQQDLGFESKIARMECEDVDHDVAFNEEVARLKFDIMLIDIFPLSGCMMFMALRHNVPFMLAPPHLDIEMVRSPALPSFTPSVLSLQTDNMSFLERFKNTFFTVLITVPAFGPFVAMKDLSLVKKYNKDPDVSSWYDVARKAELFFVSRGPVLEYALPLTPNVINIECLTCKPAKPLSKDIEAMISGANGIIVVSFGSLIDEFPDFIAKKFLEAFAERDELIFWRYRPKLPGPVPSNVNVMKWLPQNDLLAHPKTKLFITHSGNNGQYESIYHGVPMLAFPLFAEQHHNAHRMVHHGYGLEATFLTFTSEELAEKMAEIINNSSYKEKATKGERIIKSMAMDARQTSVFWIEHVLEFGGDHLRSYGTKMPWYSFYMIDILLFTQAIILFLCCLFFGTCYIIVRRFCASKSKEKIQ